MDTKHRVFVPNTVGTAVMAFAVVAVLKGSAKVSIPALVRPAKIEASTHCATERQSTCAAHLSLAFPLEVTRLATDGREDLTALVPVSSLQYICMYITKICSGDYDGD